MGERYADQLPPEQFMYSMLTRSQRISHENLRLRDKAWLEGFERWFAERGRAAAAGARPAPPPMFTPYTVRSVTLKNRVVVSPMAQYYCVDGLPGDFHLIHLGARALGGAGMVVAEMTCPSADARITPGCPGLWNEAQRDAWKRIVDMRAPPVGREDRAADRPCRAQGLDQRALGRDGADRPLPAGNWPLLAASALPYLDDGAVPRAMTRADMDRVRDDFVRSTRYAAEAGFDWLELHCAHGYLLQQLHLAADQPAQRRLRRQPGQPPALPAGGVCRGARGLADSTCRCRCASRHTTGSTAASRPTTRCRSPGPSRPPVPT